MAKLISTWSKDPSTKVGAVVVDDDGRLLVQGWNGFPRGIKDTRERLDTREEKYKYIVHAEQNCLYNSSYIGVSLRDANMLVYGLPPCPECAKGIIQTGIKRVFFCSGAISGPWVEAYEKSIAFFNETGIECTNVIL